MDQKNAWLKYTKKEDRQKVMDFAEDYRKFLSGGKTERECTSFFAEEAEKAGFKNLDDIIAADGKVKAGEIYIDGIRVNENKVG